MQRHNRSPTHPHKQNTISDSSKIEWVNEIKILKKNTVRRFQDSEESMILCGCDFFFQVGLEFMNLS